MWKSVVIFKTFFFFANGVYPRFLVRMTGLYMLNITSSMEQYFYWEARSRCAKVPFFLWHRKAHYDVHKCPSPDPAISQMNRGHSLVKIRILILSSHLCLPLPRLYSENHNYNIRYNVLHTSSWVSRNWNICFTRIVFVEAGAVSKQRATPTFASIFNTKRIQFLSAVQLTENSLEKHVYQHNEL